MKNSRDYLCRFFPSAYFELVDPGNRLLPSIRLLQYTTLYSPEGFNTIKPAFKPYK